VARCFLETQAYDHPTWPAFVREETAFFTESVESDWNESWLRRLHLLNVVLKDAEDSARTLKRGLVPATVESVFHRLVGTNEERLIKLFSAYASQDAAAAFRLAQAVQVDLVKRRPDLIVENSAEPPFLALIVRLAQNERSRARLWATILAEAGLRYRVVAKRLTELPPVDQWKELIESIPKRRRWRTHATSDSFYSQCITLAVRSVKQGEPAPELPGISYLQSIKTSSRIISNWYMARVLMGGVLLVLLSFIPVFWVLAGDRPPGITLGIAAASVGFLILYISGALFVLVGMRQVTLYWVILNLIGEASARQANLASASDPPRKRGTFSSIIVPTRLIMRLARIRYRRTYMAAVKFVNWRRRGYLPEGRTRVRATDFPQG
jgi:hypothetical protein